jgi:hypothetical protein
MLDKILAHLRLTTLLSFSLFCGNGMTANCFNDKLPSFIEQADFSNNYGETEWLSMIISADYKTLFVGGKSQSKKIFPGT